MGWFPLHLIAVDGSYAFMAIVAAAAAAIEPEYLARHPEYHGQTAVSTGHADRASEAIKSHDPAVVKKMSGRVAVIHQGADW